MKKIETYIDKLMRNKDFRKMFIDEYKKLCVEEKKDRDLSKLKYCKGILRKIIK